MFNLSAGCKSPGAIEGTSLPNACRLAAQTHQCPQQHLQICGYKQARAFILKQVVSPAKS